MDIAISVFIGVAIAAAVVIGPVIYVLYKPEWWWPRR